MKKILVIRFSSIGDIVLTTPVIRCIKEQLKGIELHYLTKNNFKGILETNPHIDKIHTIERKVSEIIPQLKKEDFDFIVDLHHNLRTLQVKQALRKPHSSFNKLNIEKWMMVSLKINRLPDEHIVDRYFETVEKLNVKNDGKGLDYFIPAKDEVNIASLPATHRNGYIGFVIGAAHATKQLPIEKIISICKKLNQPVVLLGGKEETEKGEQIKKAVGELIFNSCGKYNLNQSASLVKQAQKIITHDTGLMHIAAAFQKPIVSVWGNTIPEFGMYPYYGDKGQETWDRGQGTGGSKGQEIKESRSKIIEVKNLSCRPCTKIGFDKCPRRHFKCMNEISEEQVVRIVQSL